MNVLLAALLRLEDGGAVAEDDAVLVRFCHARLKQRIKETLDYLLRICLGVFKDYVTFKTNNPSLIFPVFFPKSRNLVESNS